MFCISTLQRYIFLGSCFKAGKELFDYAHWPLIRRSLTFFKILLLKLGCFSCTQIGAYWWNIEICSSIRLSVLTHGNFDLSYVDILCLLSISNLSASFVLFFLVEMGSITRRTSNRWYWSWWLDSTLCCPSWIVHLSVHDIHR